MMEQSQVSPIAKIQRRSFTQFGELEMWKMLLHHTEIQTDN